MNCGNAQQHRSSRLRSLLKPSHPALLVAVLGLLVVSVLAAPYLVASGAAATVPPVSHDRTGLQSHATPAVAATPAAGADPSDKFVCRAINSSICVSVQALSPQIVPSVGNSTASARVNASQSINLWIKSKYPLVSVSPASPTGDNATTPIRINVTGTLWNGDPWMNPWDGTVWHADSDRPYFSVPAGNYNGGNSTYKYWYNLTIANASGNGQPNFFPGEYVTWQIYIVEKNSLGEYIHITSPTFHYWIQGAWAFSPYKGSQQYGGPNASSLDLEVTQNPIVPNWNDTVKVTIATTAPDLINNASICDARLLVTAVLPNGAPLTNYTGQYHTIEVGTTCSENVTANIPASYQQVQGTIVYYSVVAFDGYDTARFPADQIATPVYQYIVGGNGSFIAHTFQNDVGIQVSPQNLLAGITIPPGTNVSVTITSLNAGTALQSAQIVYSFSLAPIKEIATGTVFMSRINSTTLTARMPGMPLGGFVNFTVLVWDYSGDLEISPQYGYSVQSLASLIPTIDPTLGFLWVYVYDNSTSTWVSNASVVISGGHGFLNLDTHTFFGVAYPNATSEPFVPLLLLANQTYTVNVSAAGAPAMSVAVTLRHTMTEVATLEQAPDYTIVESGNALYFWINTTAPGPTYSAAAQVNPQLYAPAIGLLLGGVAAVFFFVWYRQISNRRKEQERRVTL